MTTKSPAAKPAARLSAGTRVEAAKTKMEIETYLDSRGAENTVVARDHDSHRIVCHFRLFGRVIRMYQALPDRDSKAIGKMKGFRAASEVEIQQSLDAETRRKWRVLLLRIKLRLDLIFDEVDEDEREDMFLHEFLADTQVSQNGPTVGEWMEPQVAAAYEHGQPIQLLPQPQPFRGNVKQLEEENRR